MSENSSESTSKDKIELLPINDAGNTITCVEISDQNSDSDNMDQLELECKYDKKKQRKLEVLNECVSSDKEIADFSDIKSIASSGSKMDTLSNNFDQLFDLLEDVSSECSELNLKYSNTAIDLNLSKDEFIGVDDDDDDDEYNSNIKKNNSDISHKSKSPKSFIHSMSHEVTKSTDNESTNAINEGPQKSNSIKKRTSFFGNKIALRRKRSDRDDDYYHTVRESKLKCRVTIFNAYNAIQKEKTNKISNRPISFDELKEESSDIKDYVVNFVKSELGYIKCVHYVTTFEKLIISSMKQSASAVFSKNNYNKLSLHYTELDNHLKDMETFLNEKLITLDCVDSIIEYFSNMVSQHQTIKNIASNMDRFLALINKNKTSTKMKKIYPQSLSIPEWNESVCIELSIEKIFHRVINYIEFLNGLILLCNYSPEISNKLRLLNNDLIILWDIVGICRIGKKLTKLSRTLTCTAPVVEFCPDSKRKYRLIFVFMDCLVIGYQSSKNPNEIISKYCLSLKRCVSYRKFQGGIELESSLATKLNQLEGEIAAAKDALSPFNKSIKKLTSSKADKIYKQLNNDQYELSLLSPKYPLTICYNQKITLTFLFSNDEDTYNWEYIINGRANNTLMDESTATINEIQPLVNDVMKTTLCANCDHSPNKIDTYVEEPPINTNDMLTVKESVDDSSNYINCNLILKVMFRRFDNNNNNNNNSTNGDIFLKLECDHYGIFFTKYKSNILKPNESCSEIVIIAAEKTKEIKFLFYKTKSKLALTDIGPINLCELGIQNKPFVRIRKSVQKIGVVIVYGECFKAKFSVKNSSQSVISMIDHFQPSIEAITKSENVDVPDVLRICVKRIEDVGLEDVGLYRISGTTNKINQLRERFTMNLILDPEDLVDYDVHDITGLVKSFFRDLKQRLIPKNCVRKFFEWNISNNKNIESLHGCVESLPRSNQNVFYFLMNHLVNVSKYSNINKMSNANISTVFGPNLFGGEDNDGSKQDSFLTYVTIVKSLIDTYESSSSES